MHTPIVDTHLHLIYRDRLSYPWLADVPPLNRDFSYETYAVEARRCGVTDALHMEVDVARDDIEAETRECRGPCARARTACCAARSARAGRRTTAFPPFSNASSPIRS